MLRIIKKHCIFLIPMREERISPEHIRQEIPLSSWISRRTPLQKKGAHWTGLCPFHKERSPSFSVNDQRGTYHCFGCGAHGDIIDFVQEEQGLSFSEALEILAQELPGASQAGSGIKKNHTTGGPYKKNNTKPHVSRGRRGETAPPQSSKNLSNEGSAPPTSLEAAFGLKYPPLLSEELEEDALYTYTTHTSPEDSILEEPLWAQNPRNTDNRSPFSFPKRGQEKANWEAIPLKNPTSLSPSLPNETPSWLYPLLLHCAQWYHQQLLESSYALDYVKNRGLSLEDIERFLLGFSPSSIEGHTSGKKPEERAFSTKESPFLKAAKAAGFSQQQLLQAGLLAKNTRNSTYEVFRNRLMFPIWDWRGRIAAFGARHLPEAADGQIFFTQSRLDAPEKPQNRAPKYLNSPTSPWFLKSQALYHLPRQRYCKEITRGNPVILVEGYLDVIALTGNGIAAMAPLGTALGAPQLQRLWRADPSPVICFDGDQAGKKATLKTALLALPLIRSGFDLRFLSLPAEYDPLSFLNTYGPYTFHALLKEAKGLCEYLWEQLFSASEKRSPETIAKNKSLWRQWLDTISDKDIVQAYKDFFYANLYKKAKTSTSVLQKPSQMMHHKILLGMLIFYPWLTEQVREGLSQIVFPPTIFPPGNMWLQIRNFMLSWRDGSSLNILYSTLGTHGYQEVCKVAQHFPHAWPKTLDHWFSKEENSTKAVSEPSENFIIEVVNYWGEVFNAYQTHIYRPQEIKELKNRLWQVPGTWERLQILTQF